MTHDLIGTAEAIRNGAVKSSTLMQASMAAAKGSACAAAFVGPLFDSALVQARAIDLQQQAGLPLAPLAGLSISVKDLFDVAGWPTTAASRAMLPALPAARDCPAVARLRQAGAALLGHCNMSEFAFSGVGINPHYGTPINPATLKLDPTPRIPGGSTSGGAVSVAAGAAWATLGSDTGGSIRIPAALQGLVGFKNTQRLTPNEGSIPLSQSLDTTCAITLSVRDAVLMHEILANRSVRLNHRPLRARRFAVVKQLMQDGMDTTVSTAFERTLALLRDAGAQIETISVAPLLELASLLAHGSLPAAESWAWHKQRLSEREPDYDPRVARRIRLGEQMSAADYIAVLQGRQTWIARMQAVLQDFDAMLSPTVPIVAPVIAPLLTSDEQFFSVNAQLLRNTSIVNMLDGCAISIPCHGDEEMPVGLMIWSSSLRDDTVLDAAVQIEATLNLHRSPLTAATDK